MDLRIISLDIETANLDMDAEGLSFGDPKGWRTSCVCIHNSTTGITNNIICHPKENYLQISTNMWWDYAGIVYPFDNVGQYHLRANGGMMAIHF